MKFGSLFSGAGGMDLGLERSGMQCKWQVENNPFRIKVLEKNWPYIDRYRDIREFRQACELGYRAESVDLIAGGFPCQQTSQGAAIHGKRIGLDGKDSGLWFDMQRILQLVQPRFVIVENTLGARKWAPTIQVGLEEAGYHVPEKPLQLSAWDVGAPHLRRRLFWVTNHRETGPPLTWPERPSTAISESWRSSARDNWQAAVTGIRGMDDRISNRMDRHRTERIKACGDAVCPLDAEWIGQQIIKASK